MPSRRFLALLVAGTFTATVLSGCDIGRESFSDDAVEQTAITDIEVSGGRGDILVQPGDGSLVEIHRTVSYRPHRMPPPREQTWQVEGDRLLLHTDCQADDCGVSYEIRVPNRVRVTGGNGSGSLHLIGVSAIDYRLDSGDITVRDATGEVNVETGSGDIMLIDVSGPSTARSSNGDIQAFGARSGKLTTQTGSGDVELELAVPLDVYARTDAGDIRVAAPSGDYRVNTMTGSGDVQVRIASNPNGQRLLDLETGSGNIAVNPR